jgi:predicted dehydrogenase
MDINKDVLDEIEMVFISTPASTHYFVCKFFLLHNKHVFCEKPIALKKEEAEELFNIAIKKKVILMEGLVYLFNPSIRYIKKIIS